MAGYSPVLFNSIDLSLLPGVMIIGIDHHKRPTRTSNWQKVARGEGKKLVNSNYAERLITVNAILSGNDRATYEANRDNLLLYLQPQEAVLRIPQTSGSRDYVCTVDDVDYPDLPQGGYADINIKFMATNPPFGKDTAVRTASNSRFTAATKTDTFAPVIGGNMEAVPLITVTVNGGTGLTSAFIQIKNPASGKLIKVTRTWVAADVLVIDVENQTVKVNGTAVDFTGVFPKWQPSDAQIQYDDNFTTRDATMNMTYKRRWL